MAVLVVYDEWSMLIGLWTGFFGGLLMAVLMGLVGMLFYEPILNAKIITISSLLAGFVVAGIVYIICTAEAKYE